MEREIVINTQYGGFGLSHTAICAYNDRAQAAGVPSFNECTLCRDDPILVQVVRDLGRAAGDAYSVLKIVRIPADVKWTIKDYDGMEHVAEVHRTWE